MRVLVDIHHHHSGIPPAAGRFTSARREARTTIMLVEDARPQKFGQEYSLRTSIARALGAPLGRGNRAAAIGVENAKVVVVKGN